MYFYKILHLNLFILNENRVLQGVSFIADLSITAVTGYLG